MTMLDILLYDGFDHHADDGATYAAELEAVAEAEVPAKHLVQFAKVGVHTIGEHLGEWPRAEALAARLLEHRTPDAETARAWGHLYVAAMLSGDPAGAAGAEIAFCRGLGADFRAAIVEMKFMLVAALVGCGRAAEGAAIYQGALRHFSLIQPYFGRDFCARLLDSIRVALGREADPPT